jgi:hypothetical protein
MMRDVLVAEQAVELDDGLVLLLREVAALEVRPEVVDPPQAAALAAAGQAGGLGQGAPAPLSVRLDVGNETVVLFLGPGALVGVRLLAARRPPHGADGAFLDSCWCAPSRWWVAQQSRGRAVEVVVANCDATRCERAVGEEEDGFYRHFTGF